MIRSILRSVTFGTAALGAMLAAQSASATVYAYSLDDGNATATAGRALTYTSGTGSSALTLSVYGAHANDSKNSAGLNTVSTATAETWSGYGLGVLYGSDTAQNGTHQIDNVGGGVDFMVLQFSQAVSLADIYRTAYDGYDGDASYMAYTGTLASLANGVNENGFSSLGYSSSTNYQAATNSTASSAIWLVAANVGTTDRNDAFKITDLKVSTATPTAAVPEPASWALMIVGFGVVGGSVRRRKSMAGTLLRA